MKLCAGLVGLMLAVKSVGVGDATASAAPHRTPNHPSTTSNHLWANYWDGSAWHWTDQGRPPGGIAFGVGTISYNGNPYAFVFSPEHER